MIFLLNGTYFEHSTVCSIANATKTPGVVVTLANGLRIEQDGITAEQTANVIQAALASEATTPGSTALPLEL